MVIKTKAGKAYFCNIGFHAFQVLMLQVRLGNVVGRLVCHDGRDGVPIMVPFGDIDFAQIMREQDLPALKGKT